MTQSLAVSATNPAILPPALPDGRSSSWQAGEPRPAEIRAWARRCEARAPEGFSVGPGWPAEIVAEALLLLAEKRERRASARRR